MNPDIRELNSLAARGLVSMFDAEKQLFCHRLVLTARGLVREGLAAVRHHDFARAPRIRPDGSTFAL